MVVCIVTAMLVAILIACIWLCFAGDVQAAEVGIPRAALKYRTECIRAGHAFWGLDAPTATIGAQIQTESWWNPDTESSAGAQGLAQFLPSTARWLSEVVPAVGSPAPFDPRWSLRACVAYDKYLWDRMRPMRAAFLAACDRIAFVLSGYNGGLGWVGKDRALSARRGLDPDVYFGNVETVNAGRKPSSIRENRRYVALIFERQAAYVKAGWGPGVICEN